MKQIEPLGIGPHAVGSTNFEVAPEYAAIGDEAMHAWLSGRPAETGHSRYLSDILRYPESAWITDVPVPEQPALYGPVSGQSLPVAMYLTYPSSASHRKNRYAFPYEDAQYGVFEDMLGPGETPRFADPGKRYPLVILAHGLTAHGIYDVGHAHSLASHGYVVAVLFYGDERTAMADDAYRYVGFLRPLLTRAALDSIIGSDAFGAHIDPDNIGIAGHSFGGFTALALAGGLIAGDAATVCDRRIKVGAIAAPWVGGNDTGTDQFAFGPDNVELSRVSAPMICFFGTKDEDTLASFILPAMRHLSGPTYVVELVGQPHVFEQRSWQDRDNWELLFFAAFLQNDEASLATLEAGWSMKGGNHDIQRFEYQRSAGDVGWKFGRRISTLNRLN